jgi:DNA polymerase III sliding clamp (beta) subunit (PCNA family)
MILETKEFKKICSVILTAADNGGANTLELITEGNTLTLNVTNQEYYVSAKFPLEQEEALHATISAASFLKLISQITTDTVEIKTTDTFLKIKANGSYKLPLVFNNDALLTLPKIIINNPTVNMIIDGNNLVSMLNINSEELLKTNKIVKPVQNLYYLDDEGAITFTDGACVNNFHLPQPVKVLLNSKLVKLFKLFKDEQVSFVLGYDEGFSSTIQTKVMFETANIKLTAITPSDDNLLLQVPVKAIRDLANQQFTYSLVVNKEALNQTLTRLLVFTDKNNILSTVGMFEATKEGLLIADAKNNAAEQLIAENGSNFNDCDNYTFYLSLLDLKNIVDTCTEEFITINFGNKKAVVLVRSNIKYVLPEKVEKIYAEEKEA